MVKPHHLTLWAYQEPAMGTQGKPQKVAATTPKPKKPRKPAIKRPAAPRPSRSKYGSLEERQIALAQQCQKFAEDRVEYIFQYRKSVTLYEVSDMLAIGYDAARIFMKEAETRGLVHNTHVKDDGRTLWVKGKTDKPLLHHPLAKARIERCWGDHKTLTARELCEIENIAFGSARVLILNWAKLGLVREVGISAHGTKHWEKAF